jgi:hypothetical protein
MGDRTRSLFASTLLLLSLSLSMSDSEDDNSDRRTPQIDEQYTQNHDDNPGKFLSSFVVDM